MTYPGAVITVITKFTDDMQAALSDGEEMGNRIRNIKIIQIGNSRGIRLPKIILRKYGFSDSVILEEKENGILLRHEKDEKFNWAQTFQEMAKEQEDWTDFDETVEDGLDDEEFETEKI